MDTEAASQAQDLSCIMNLQDKMYVTYAWLRILYSVFSTNCYAYTFELITKPLNFISIMGGHLFNWRHKTGES